MAWEPNEVFTTESHVENEGGDNSEYYITKQLGYFLRQYVTPKGEAIYRDQLQECVHSANPYIEVNIDNVTSYNEKVGQQLFNDPSRCLDYFERAAIEFAREFAPECPPIQVLVTTNATPTPIRDVNSSHIAKLVVIPGLVISASPVTARATEVFAVCSGCQHRLSIACKNNGFTLPRKCQRVAEKEGGPAAAGGSCPLDPYIVVPDNSKFSDYQYIKIQEAPEDVPAGEMPRHISATMDRALANASIPGSRNLFVAVYQMQNVKKNVQRPVLRIVGLMGNSSLEKVARNPTELHEAFPDKESVLKAIAPEIYGMDDVKIAIAAQLFGGVRKQLPDGMKIRGDINILLLGDPSVAKSQLLKFAHRVAPIGVYTSGKGSSAAGLTASVVRQSGTGEFYLEGGAMVLADGGIVCIDEFDKMRLADRVAIHEAMEQQTISIAKAGITAVLNTRAAVLAAANPISGRFDDLKTARDNIDFQTTILSRFDLIFVLRDIKSEERDRRIAEHVLHVHSKNENQVDKNAPQLLKKYIAYSRRRCRPIIGDGALSLLKSEYVQMRSQINNNESIPITVRQLEALVRITEALAKIEMKDECKEEHVKEALRLFRVSTFDAASSGITAPDGVVNEEQRKEIEKIERYLNRRCPLGSKVPEKTLFIELQKQSFSDFCITRVLRTMIHTGQFQYQNQRKVLKRVLESLNNE